MDTFINHGSLIGEQLKAIGLTLGISIVGTLILGILVKLVLGLRPSREEENQGLDLTDHQEEGYMI